MTIYYSTRIGENRGTYKELVAGLNTAIDEQENRVVISAIPIPGSIGETGDKGPNGDQGTQGIQGIPGDKGLTGDKGVAGDKGPIGDQGPAGDPGSDAILTRMKTHTTLSNDTLAQAYGTRFSTKLTVTANRTLTTTVPVAGQQAITIILTSGTSSYTITFGSGFKPTGTLATGTSSGKVFVIHWISDGTNLYEAGRTAAMAA